MKISASGQYVFSVYGVLLTFDSNVQSRSEVIRHNFHFRFSSTLYPENGWS